MPQHLHKRHTCSLRRGDCIARAWGFPHRAPPKRLQSQASGRPTEDPPSKGWHDVHHDHRPSPEPMIHKDTGSPRTPGIRHGVCDGIKDHLVRNPDDPKDTKRVPIINAFLNAPSRPSNPSIKSIPSLKLARPHRASYHLEGVGGQRLLRPRVHAEYLVPAPR
jgi:hypothetical protein